MSRCLQRLPKWKNSQMNNVCYNLDTLASCWWHLCLCADSESFWVLKYTNSTCHNVDDVTVACNQFSVRALRRGGDGIGGTFVTCEYKWQCIDNLFWILTYWYCLTDFGFPYNIKLVTTNTSLLVFFPLPTYLSENEVYYASSYRRHASVIRGCNKGMKRENITFEYTVEPQ